MTGIEKIKAKILEDANARALAIEEQAKQEARNILDKASEESGQKKAELLSKADSESMEVYRRLIAVAGLEGRKEILRARQDMVEAAFKKAMDRIVRLPDKEYQKLLEDMAVDAAVSDDSGEILLSEKDINRIDSKFSDNINKRLSSEGKKGSLVLSGEKINTAGGIVLRYGEMEINSTLEILFDMLRPQLENDVVKILFDML